MSRARLWVLGARPRTLGASVVPVLVGTAAAGRATPWRTLGCFVVALGMQVGVNYANDYADGVRGVDTAARVGPVRLTAAGLVPARAVARAAAVSLALAGAAGVALALAAGPVLLALGAAAVAAAALYSGGPRPYASLGLGEVSVFVFFGLVAVCGTAYAQAERVDARAWWAAVPVGLLAVAILVANNLRDIATDAAAGKRTLAVRLGEARTRALFALSVSCAFAVIALGASTGVLPPMSLAALLPMLLVPRVRDALRAPSPPVGLLPLAALLHALTGLLLAAGIAIG